MEIILSPIRQRATAREGDQTPTTRCITDRCCGDERVVGKVVKTHRVTLMILSRIIRYVLVKGDFNENCVLPPKSQRLCRARELGQRAERILSRNSKSSRSLKALTRHKLSTTRACYKSAVGSKWFFAKNKLSSLASAGLVRGLIHDNISIIRCNSRSPPFKCESLWTYNRNPSWSRTITLCCYGAVESHLSTSAIFSRNLPFIKQSRAVVHKSRFLFFFSDFNGVEDGCYTSRKFSSNRVDYSCNIAIKLRLLYVAIEKTDSKHFYTPITPGLSNTYKLSRSARSRSITLDRRRSATDGCARVNSRSCPSWLSCRPRRARDTLAFRGKWSLFSATGRPHFLFQWLTDRYTPRFLPNDLERALRARARARSSRV